MQINPVSYLLPAFATPLTAGFVAEIIIRRIIFRLLEDKPGTTIALVILGILFAMLHINVSGATTLSLLSTAMQAGVLTSAVYVFSRSLWATIFLHFAWDFSEPGIFGAINPGNSIEQALITNKISGPACLTGGQLGPQNSIRALLLSAPAAMIFLLLAKRHDQFKKPSWK